MTTTGHYAHDQQHFEQWVAAKGTTPPSNPEAGQPWYRTDHVTQYHYDATRSKWLGPEIHLSFVGVGSIAAGTYLRYGAIVTSSAIGWRVPWAAVLTGLFFDQDAAVVGNFEVRLDGSSVYSVSHNAAGGGVFNVNVDLSGAAVLAAYNESGTVSNPVVNLILRRNGG